jgi:hypothetical protein
MPPGFQYLFIYDFKHLVIAPDAKILIVAPKFGAEYSVLFGKIVMVLLPTPLPYRFHGPSYTLRRCLAFNHPVTLSGFSPVMGKSEKVKCVLFVV